MIRFYLDFITSGHGKRYIDEPEGIDGMDFMLQKEDDRVAIDSFLAAGNNRIRFNNRVNHCFDIIMYNYDMFGYEAIIKFGMEFDEDNRIIGELELSTRDTDNVTFIEVSIRDENYKLRLKRNEEINTNLFSPTDIKGNEIVPCTIHNVLLKAKPIVQVSRWETPEGGGQSTSVSGLGGTGNPVIRNFNFNNISVQYDIQNSLSYTQGDGDANDFGYIEALENIQDVRVEITNLSYTIAGTGNGSGSVSLRWFVGLDEELTNTSGGQALEFDSIDNEEFVEHINESYTKEIPLISRGQKLYLWFRSTASAETNFDTFGLVTTIESMDVKITGTSVAYNTVVPMVRVRDALKYVVKSASGLDVDMPRWDEGGEFYDQFITSTPLLRNLRDKPLNMTFKDITDDYFPEIYGDFQIREDGKVFMGRYPDFYKDIDLYKYTRDQFHGFTRTSNPRYCAVQIFYKYESYASQKENSEENTYDIVHGESQNKIMLDTVQNKKEVSVGWIRDAFMLELARRKGYDISDTAATQDDDKIYIVDVVALRDEDRTYTETSLLQHTVDGMTLTLTNDSSFSWIHLGLTPATPFIINTEPNNGNYIIITIDDRVLTLLSLGEAPVDIAEQNTNYTYTISSIITSLTNRTGEGFSEILNIDNGDRFANLRFTVGRNIRNYYSEYLAAANTYSGESLKNTLYRNNGAASTRLTAEVEPVIESGDYLPEGQILTPEKDTVSLTMSLLDLLNLMKDIRSKNGYITYIDSNGYITKGYIYKCSYQIQNVGKGSLADFIGTLDAEVEIKYEKFLLEIFSDGNGVVIINNDTPVVGFNFQIDEFQKITIFDGTGKRVYPPVLFNRVKVNNSDQASSSVELTQWLNAII